MLGAGPITANSAADWEDEDAGLHEEAPAAEPAKPVVMKAKHVSELPLSISAAAWAQATNSDTALSTILCVRS